MSKPGGKITATVCLATMALAAALCVARDVFNPNNRVMNLIFEAPIAVAIFAFCLMGLCSLFSKS